MILDELISRCQAEVADAQSRIETLRAAQARAASDAAMISEIKAQVVELQAKIVELQAGIAKVTYDFESDFTRNWTDSGFMEQARDLGKRATIVTVDGKACVRLHTKPGDDDVNGSGQWERNDFTTSQATTDGYEGREHLWEHSVWFPDDYVQPPQSELGGVWHAGLVFDFHNTANRGGQANFQVAIYPKTAISPDRPTGMHLQLHAGNPAAPTKVDVAVQKGEITKNKWYHFKYHVRWAADSTGFFKARVDDVLYMDHKGPTLYTGEGVYLKLANYHSPMGEASSVVHTRVVRST